MGDPVDAMRKAREAYTRALKEYLEGMEATITLECLFRRIQTDPLPEISVASYGCGPSVGEVTNHVESFAAMM